MTVLQTIAVAFAMFSALPVPQFEWNEKNMRYAMCAFPLIGLVCGPFGIEKVIQGARTESVPLGELKKLSEQRKLLFDEALMEFAMGNCVTLEDTNGNRKLYKQRHDKKIDAVAALMDAYVAWKLNRDAFE